MYTKIQKILNVHFFDTFISHIPLDYIGKGVKNLDNNMGYVSVERWLGRLSPSTVKSSKSNFNRFLEWLSVNGGKFATMSPDELIQYQKQATGDARYEILDLLQIYIQTRKGTHEYCRVQMTAVRSFFAHNRATLERDITFRIKGTKQSVVGSLSPDEVRTVILSCNLTYQTIFLIMLQSGLGEEEFIYWSQNGLASLKEQLEVDANVIRVDLTGRKSNKNVKSYYTLISGDGLARLRDYMTKRPTLLTKNLGEKAIFINQYGKPITKNAIYQNWTSHSKKVGVNRGKGWTGKNLHELRDTFRTLWEKSPAEKSVGEYLMGHVVDSLGYNKAHQDQQWVTAEYKQALPWLNILSSSRGYGLVREDVIIEQQNRIDKQDETIRELVKGYQNLQKLYIKNSEAKASEKSE